MTSNLRYALLALLVLIAGAGLHVVPAESAKLKPDLSLINSGLIGNRSRYAFAGATANIRVFDIVKNTGKAIAGRSKIELALYHGRHRLEAITRTVGVLDPGEVSKANVTVSIDIPSDAKLGEYEVQVCVDARDQVNELDEFDNCDDHIGQFYIARKEWSGSFSGSYDRRGLPVEEWSTTDAHFKFQEYTNPGKFQYEITYATLVFKTSGSDGACTWTGSGIETNPVGQLDLRYHEGTYEARVKNAPGFSYPIILEGEEGCSDAHDVHGPYAGADALVFLNKPLPFGVDELGGVFSAPGTATHYIWNLR